MNKSQKLLIMKVRAKIKAQKIIDQHQKDWYEQEEKDSKWQPQSKNTNE